MPAPFINQLQLCRSTLLDTEVVSRAKHDSIMLTLKMLQWSESLGLMDHCEELHADLRALFQTNRWNFALDGWLR